MNYPAFATESAGDFYRRSPFLVVAGMTALAALALAVRVPAVPVHGILPLLMGCIIVTELISSALFFNVLLRSRERCAAFAAGAYLLAVILSFPYLLLFPNVFAPGVPFGQTVQASFEFWIAWHAGYAFALLGYAVSLRFGAGTLRRPRAAAWLTALTTLAVAAVVSAAVLRGTITVPLVAGTQFTRVSTATVMPALCALNLLAIAALWRFARARNPLHVWLSVALYASLLDVVLGIACARYTSGWYAGKFLALASSGTMVVLFVSVFSRMYGDALRSNAELGRARERDAELNERSREQHSRLLSQAGSVAKFGTWELDPRSGSMRWSDELYEMFALPKDSVVSRDAYLARVHPDDRAQVAALFVSRNGDAASFEHRLISGSGDVRLIEGRAECIRAADGRVERWFGTILDRTEGAHIKARLARALTCDPATGLPNRNAARAHLVDRLLLRGPQDAPPLAVMILDVDRMKSINDAVGPSGGDRCLEIVAARVKEAAGDAYAARWHGDEFIVVHERSEQRDDVAIFARRILKAASQATVIFNREFALSVSIGIAMFPGDAATADELIRCADIAMYEAKASGRNAARFFSSAMRDQRIEHAMLESEIRSAMRLQQFHLAYQPIIDARTGDLFGAEALLRWTHATRGAVSPALVVEIAERSGLMGRLGSWVLSEGIRQRARWAHRPMTIALNVSASQLQNEDFTLLLGRMLSSIGVKGGEIELEVTESAAMEGPLIADQMRACLSLGVHFSLDDFGTHYSSISYLQRLTVDRIKIDRTFVRDLPSNERDAAIVRALIALAHSLGRTVIAEGVEDQRQLAWLREAGCDYIQGFAIARPMAAPAFERWVEARYG